MKDFINGLLVIVLSTGVAFGVGFYIKYKELKKAEKALIKYDNDELVNCMGINVSKKGGWNSRGYYFIKNDSLIDAKICY